jgi:hypothetical protein
MRNAGSPASSAPRRTWRLSWCAPYYVALCRAHGYFTPAFYAKATHLERIHVRRRLKQVTNAHGWPVFGNIERVDPDGKPERVFLQEELFGPEEYQQIVAYHCGMARHHLIKAQTYREHAKMRYSLELPLFSEDDVDVSRAVSTADDR